MQERQTSLPVYGPGAHLSAVTSESGLATCTDLSPQRERRSWGTCMHFLKAALGETEAWGSEVPAWHLQLVPASTWFWA